jgi:hypothetical protein
MLMPGIKLRFLVSLVLMSAILLSCGDPKQEKFTEKDKIASVGLGIHRYEQALFPLDPQTLETSLPALSKEYSFFLGDQYLEPENLARLKEYLSDSLIRSLYVSTQKAYPSLDTLENELGVALAYYQESFPGRKIPEVYTYISGLDYENPVRFVDSVLLIALDMYLGSSARYYQQLGIPAYKCLGMDREYIAGDCMKQIAFPLIRDSKRDKTLLDWMLMQGKVLYFLDLTLPGKEDALKIAYSPAQLEWCKENEAMIWSFLISKKLLYNTDKQQVQDFIADAPFTKGFPKESPGRTGVWTGWQIVRAYMKNNPKISLQELFNNEDAQQILQHSGYKPKK